MTILSQLQALLSRALAPCPKAGDRGARKFIIRPAVEDWTADDCLLWRKFLGTPTGQKLILISGGEASETAMKECCGDTATPQASGMSAMLRFQFNLASDVVFQSLSGEAPAQASNTADREQEAAAPVETSRSF